MRGTPCRPDSEKIHSQFRNHFKKASVHRRPRQNPALTAPRPRKEPRRPRAAEVSHFLHSQSIDAVNKHIHVFLGPYISSCREDRGPQTRRGGRGPPPHAGPHGAGLDPRFTPFHGKNVKKWPRSPRFERFYVRRVLNGFNLVPVLTVFDVRMAAFARAHTRAREGPAP